MSVTRWFLLIGGFGFSHRSCLMIHRTKWQDKKLNTNNFVSLSFHEIMSRFSKNWKYLLYENCMCILSRYSCTNFTLSYYLAYFLITLFSIPNSGELWMSFMNIISYAYFASVFVVPYAKSCYVGRVITAPDWIMIASCTFLRNGFGWVSDFFSISLHVFSPFILLLKYPWRHSTNEQTEMYGCNRRVFDVRFSLSCYVINRGVYIHCCVMYRKVSHIRRTKSRT